MRSFKEQLEKDFSQTFFNPAEFGEIHTINGDEILIVVDNETLLELSLTGNLTRSGRCLKIMAAIPSF